MTVTDEDRKIALNLARYASDMQCAQDYEDLQVAIAKAVSEVRERGMQACQTLATDLLYAHQRIAELEKECQSSMKEIANLREELS